MKGDAGIGSCIAVFVPAFAFEARFSTIYPIDFGKNFMAFFNSAVGVLQTLIVALGASLGIWGAINLLEGNGNDNCIILINVSTFISIMHAGWIIGDYAMSAISISMSLTIINGGISALIGVGSASILSRTIGKGDKEKTDKIFGNFSQAGNMTMRGEGALKQSMMIMGVGALLNIILDPIFMKLMGKEEAIISTKMVLANRGGCAYGFHFRGAVAKGFATELLARSLEKKGIANLMLSVGGNIRTLGYKPDENGNPVNWAVGTGIRMKAAVKQ